MATKTRVIQEFKQQEKILLEQQIQEHQNMMNLLRTELKTKYSDEQLLQIQQYNQLAQQLQEVDTQIAICDADIALHREKGYAFNDVIAERRLLLNKADSIRAGMALMDPGVNSGVKVLSDSQTVLATSSTRKKVDADLKSTVKTNS